MIFDQLDMPRQKRGNMYAHKNFGLEATFAGLVATLKQNQTRLIACVDISNLKLLKV